MKNLLIIWLLASLLQGCDALKKDSDFTPLLPDNTPFIVGVLEATQDTVQHYPEVYVGTLSNPEGFKAEQVWITSGIWWPITNALVTRPVTRMDLKRVSDTKAKVTIRGPMDQPNERTVQFSHEGKGVYGDTQYQLPLEGGGVYQMSIKMGNDDQYTATTRLPEIPEWHVPNKENIKLKLDQYSNGVYYEEEIKKLSYPFTVDSSIGYMITQINSEYDHRNFKAPIGALLFESRGNFLRFGAHYGVIDAFDFPDKRSFEVGWVDDENHPIGNSKKLWLTFSQFNVPLSNFYYSVLPQLSGNSGGRWDQQDSARIEVIKNRDGSYLFNYMSNIKKIGKKGQVLPKEDSDAFGVFGGYSAAYRNLTVIPQRSWDPDTLNWGNQGK